MLHIDKTFLVCAGKNCGNVLGCFKDGEPHRFCETTRPGDEERTFGCDKKQFFECTHEKDMVVCEEAKGKIQILPKSTCRHCPPDKPLELTEEEMGPVAHLSSPVDTDELTDLLLSLDEVCCK